jgi:hypothetical protein
LSVLLLVTASPALRHIADGNFEGLVIAGACLLVYGYQKRNLVILALGLLLATAKPQETWLLVIATGFYLVKAWPPRQWLKLGAIIAAIAIPALLLFGGAWVAAMANIQPPPGTLVDISLKAAVGRLGLSPSVWTVLWLALFVATALIVLKSRPIMSREKAAMMICASLLLSPYAAGNSFLTVLAVGIIPLFQSRRLLGVVLIVLTDLSYILPREFLYWNGAYFWTTMLIGMWAIFAWVIMRHDVEYRSIDNKLLAPAK